MVSKYKRQGSLIAAVRRDDSPIDKKNPRTQFSDQILKRVIGSERAN